MIKLTLKLLAIIFILSGCSESEKNKEKLDQDSSGMMDIAEEVSHESKDCDETSSQFKPLKEMEWLHLSMREDLILGNLDSDLIIVEYSSPTCPSCAYYNRQIFPKIKEQYIDTGKIAYIFREFISNNQDLHASILARCSGDKEDRYTFLKLLLKQQNSWAFTRKYNEILTNIGSIGGVSPEQYKKCMQNKDMLDILLKHSKILSSSNGFVGTPAFFFNGKKFGRAYTYENISEEIKKYIGADEEK